MHRYFLHNDEILDAGARTLAAGQVGLLSGWGVFSTLRVYDGVMFAWERHWERMRGDARGMRVPFPDAERLGVAAAEAHAWMEQKLYRLIEANQAPHCTLRVYVVRNKGGLYEGPGIARDFDLIAFTVDVVEWPATMKLGLIHQGRHAASEFAGTKYNSWAENLTRYERAHEQGLDEVILLNEREEVSECTSANVFVVHHDQRGARVSTPPIGSGCLAGVTRAVLLEELSVAGIEIRERVLLTADLESAEEIFVTSTTRELLPVTEVRGLRIRGGRAVCERLRQEFSAYTSNYVSTRRWAAAGSQRRPENNRPTAL